MAEILPNGTFRILGRRDNVICSGGIKLHIEEIEQKLAQLSVRTQVTALPDASLGEAVTLLCEGSEDLLPEIDKACRALLQAYEVPRHYLFTEKLPLTETGKAARAEARKLAEDIFNGLK